MANAYTNQDILLTTDGDFIVAPTGDLQVATIDQTTSQDTVILLYTVYGDFASFPSLGSRIIDFIGEPNTRQNASLLSTEMNRALTASGRFAASDVSIQIVPTDIDTIASYVTIQNLASQATQNIVFAFNYIAGLSLITS